MCHLTLLTGVKARDELSYVSALLNLSERPRSPATWAQYLFIFLLLLLLKNTTATCIWSGKWIRKEWLFLKGYFWVNPLCYFLFSPDFLKQTTYEVEAFLEAIQFFRQEKGHYGTWEMLTGNDKEVKKFIPDGDFGFGYGSSEDSEDYKFFWQKRAS